MKKLIYLLILVCMIITVSSCQKQLKFENLATEEEIETLFDIFINMREKGYNYKYEYETIDLEYLNSNTKYFSNIQGQVSVTNKGTEYDVSFTRKYKGTDKPNGRNYTYQITGKCTDLKDDYQVYYLSTEKSKEKGLIQKSTKKSMISNITNAYTSGDILNKFNPLCDYINYFKSLISWNDSHLTRFIVFKEDNVYKCITNSIDYKEEYTIYLDKDTLDTVTKIEYLKNAATETTSCTFNVVSEVTISKPKDYESYLD